MNVMLLFEAHTSALLHHFRTLQFMVCGEITHHTPLPPPYRALVYGQITHHAPLPPPYNGLWTDHPPYPTPTTIWGHWSMDTSPTTPHSHHHIMVCGQITYNTPLPPPYRALVYGQITHHSPLPPPYNGLWTDHPPYPTPTTI